MQTNCSTSDYAALYAPWLTTAPDFAERFIEPRDRVLDLCGGTGRVAQKAWDMGCQDVSLLDVNPRVVPPWGSIKVQRGDANKIDKYFGPHSFDVIVCRQAIAYLDLDQVAQSATKALAPCGRLCFNNFRRPRWFRKRYEFKGNKYTEMGWYFGKQCYHLQWRHGRGWDLTKFKWHTHKEIVAAMEPWFTVKVDRTAKTNYYTCISKDI